MILQLTRPLISLDLETTGVHPNVDRIVQIGLVKLYPEGRKTQWNVLVNPGVPIPPEATEVHHISDEDVRHAPPFASREIAGVLAQGLPGCDITGFNVQFDLRFLKKEFHRAQMVTPDWGEVVDASIIYQRMVRRTLAAALKDVLGEDHPDAHNALADAEASLRLLEGELQKWPDLPRDVDSLSRLLTKPRANHIDQDGKFAWRFGEACVNFGTRSVGQPLRTVSRRFLYWMLRSDFSREVKHIVKEALEGRFPVRNEDGPGSSVQLSEDSVSTSVRGDQGTDRTEESI